MSAVPITITGILTTENGAGNATFVGMASLTGLGIGGGPIVPPPPGTGIWPNPPEGQAPLPSHPIALPGDPWWGDPHPAHPIVIPKPPTDPPPTGEANADGFIKDPPPDGGWGYHTKYGWMFDPGSGKPGPR